MLNSKPNGLRFVLIHSVVLLFSSFSPLNVQWSPYAVRFNFVFRRSNQNFGQYQCSPEPSMITSPVTEPFFWANERAIALVRSVSLTQSVETLFTETIQTRMRSCNYAKQFFAAADILYLYLCFNWSLSLALVIWHCERMKYKRHKVQYTDIFAAGKNMKN